MVKKVFSCLSPLSLLFLFPGALSAQKGEKVLLDFWEIVHLSGSRAGYAHHTARQVEIEGEKRIRTLVEAKIRIQSAGFEILIQNKVSSLEDEQGRMLHFTLERKATGKDSRIEGFSKGGLFFLKRAWDGNVSVRQIPWKKEALGITGERLAIRKHHRTPGSQFKYHTFDFRYMKIVGSTMSFHDWEETDFLGEKRKLQAVTVVLSEVGSIPCETWMDAKGNLFKSIFRGADLPMTFYRVSKEEALEGETREQGITMSGDPVIPVPLCMPYPRKADEVLYSICLPEEISKKFLPTDKRQRIESQEGCTIVMRVNRKVPSGPMPSPPYKDPQLKPFLKQTKQICWRDPKIFSVSRFVVSGEKDGWKAALKLKAWVHNNIKKSSFQVGVSTAKNVLEKGVGDSFGHSLLLTALARAARIPSRMIAGLAHFRGGLYLHYWTEVFVGEWVALDSTLPGKGVDATHVKIIENSSAEGGGEFDLQGINRFIGSFTAEILEFRRNGQIFKQTEEVRKGSIQGNLYKNPFFSVSFQKPDRARFNESFKDELPGETLIEIIPAGDRGRIAVSVISGHFNFRLSLLKHDLVTNWMMNILKYKEKSIGWFPSLDLVVEKKGKRGRLLVLKDGEMVYFLYLDSLSPEGEKALQRMVETFKTGI